MIKFSEYVSLGHPDKVADYISQYLLDRYIEKDPDTRYAMEVQVKDCGVTLGGEVSSKAKFDEFQISRFVREAVREIGYTAAYQDRWGVKNVVADTDLIVHGRISQQSPDIAQGVDRKGWGDQGIFFGYANDLAYLGHMPYEHTVAKRLCKALFECGLTGVGLDIKTQVVTLDGEIMKVIVAVPLLYDSLMKTVTDFIRSEVRQRNGKADYELIVNGTGRYVQHGFIADCGTTGRKLAVDFYGGKCRIGGGSPWTKDASKADLTLNLVARKLALGFAHETGLETFTSLACCIGKQEVDYCIQDNRGVILDEGQAEYDHKELRHYYGLDRPIYASMCRWGLFGEYQADKAWEKV